MFVIQAQPNPATLRQAAMNDALEQIIGGIQGMENNARTKRAEALAIQEKTQALRQAGYDVNEDMVKKSLEPEQSGLARFFAGTPIGQSMGMEVQGERPDLYAKRTKEWEQRQIDDRNERLYKLEGEKLDRQFKRAQIANMGVEAEKKAVEVAQMGKGKQLSASDVSKFNEGNQIPTMLKDIETTITSNEDMFGPIAGRFNSLNPYNEKSKTAESQLTAAAQTVGKYLEGGVLRAEDIPKYRKMLPDLTDTPEVAKNKLANVRRLLVGRQNSDLEALKGAGYDTSSIDRGLVAPDMPSVLTGNTGKQVKNHAKANDPMEIKSQLKGLSREEKIKMLQGR